MPESLHPDVSLGGAAWSGYIAFDHADPVTGSLDFRRALAHATDRDALAAACPANVVVASGGVVPPVLQGHTPDIALRHDPELARECLSRSGHMGAIELNGLAHWGPILGALAASWEEALDRPVLVREGSTEGAIRITGWLPGYPDPEYYLRLLFQSTSRTNEGGFADPAFDELIERARQERSDRSRLELFHEADRYAVAERVAVIPLVYGRSTAFVKPHVGGWWEFGKSSASFGDLTVAE